MPNAETLRQDLFNIPCDGIMPEFIVGKNFRGERGEQVIRLPFLLVI